MSETLALRTPLEAARVAAALEERSSRRVLASCVDAPRSAKEVSRRTGMPLATVYRQVHRLMDLGILLVERSALTSEGKKYDLYRSRVKEAHLDITEGGEGVRWTSNAEVEERLIAMWDTMRFQARE